ncbi:TPA: type II secretion system protein [Vibrio parahaemolyticus]|nr:type II secretion system protein [Vibrio parahaemolyticus]
MMKRQRGLGLLDVLFAIALLGIIYAGGIRVWMSYKENHAAENYRIRIEQVIEALQKYQYQQKTLVPEVELVDEFPDHLNDLVTEDEQFWVNCTVADEAAHRCIRPDYVPWTTERIIYAAGAKDIEIEGRNQMIPYAQLTFPLSSIQPQYRTRWSTELLRLPYAIQDESGDIVVRVYDPLISQLYDEFLQRDGSVELTNDWDVGGNYSVTNARDYTILNSDGTQKIVSQGLVDIYTVKHGDRVKKPACPEGTSPHLAMSLGQIYIDNDHELTGSQKPFIQLAGTDDNYWQVGLEIRVKSRITGDFEKANTGEITAFTQCK